MSADQTIDYESLTQDAMRGLVRAVLQRVLKHGLPGDHHFYIAFNTQAPGVSISPRLKAKYPEEMTVVLQHRFWDLHVTNQRFEIKLTFDNIPERLVVPFKAIKVFFDPSVPYGLQFEEPDFGGEAGLSKTGAGSRNSTAATAAGKARRLTQLQPRGRGAASGKTPANKSTAGKAPAKKRKARSKAESRAADRQLAQDKQPANGRDEGAAIPNDSAPDAPARNNGMQKTNPAVAKERALQGDNDQRKLNGPSPRLLEEPSDADVAQKPEFAVDSKSKKRPDSSDKPADHVDDAGIDADAEFDGSAKVVSLDAFRKK